MNIRKILFLPLLALVFSCSGPDAIPSDTMEDIITEALLTDAVITSGHEDLGRGSIFDTIDFYTPILRKYGYTLNDFRYTVDAMSSRKSNPLNEIYGRVAKAVDSLANHAEYHYRIALRIDSTAKAFYADTIYSRDTIIKGSLSKYKIVLTDLKKGTYTVMFNYTTLSDYRAGVKALGYRSSKRGDKRVEPLTRMWLNRTGVEAKFSTAIQFNENKDSLLISFVEPTVSKELKRNYRDSSYISQIKVVYDLPMKEARERYFRRYFEGSNTYKLFTNEKDSLPVYFR